MWLRWEVFTNWTGTITSVRLNSELAAKNPHVLIFWGWNPLDCAQSHSERSWLLSTRYGCAVGVSAAGRAALSCDGPPGACCRQYIQGPDHSVTSVIHGTSGKLLAGNKNFQLPKHVGLPLHCFSLQCKVPQWRWSSYRICLGSKSNSVAR